MSTDTGEQSRMTPEYDAAMYRISLVIGRVCDRLLREGFDRHSYTVQHGAGQRPKPGGDPDPSSALPRA